MSFGAYTGNFNFTVSDNPQVNGPSSSLAFGSTGNQTTITAKTPYTLGTGLGQVNQVSTNVLNIPAGSSATINLQSVTNMLGVAAVVLTALKRFVFWLLSPNDDSLMGTPSTGVTIGNAPTNPNKLDMGGPTMTRILQGVPTGSGDKTVYVSSSAAGLVVSPTAMNVLFTNNDASHPAAVYYNLAGHD